MDKLKVIIKREYLTRVRSRAFIVWTALTPILLAGLMFVPLLIARNNAQEYRIVVLDQSSRATLVERAQALLAAETAKPPVAGFRLDIFTLQREAFAAGESVEARARELAVELAAGKIAGCLIVPPDVTAPTGKLVLRARAGDRFINSGRLRNAFNTAIIEQRLATAGIDPARADELTRGVPLETVNERGEQGGDRDFIFAYVLLMVIYGSIIFYGTFVMRGVIEEKQSRIIEVMLSSVRPFELMLGKLIGIGLVSLTQFLVWLVVGVGLSVLAALPMFTVYGVKTPQLSGSLLCFFVLFFVLGYMLYSSFYVIVGAMVSQEEDAQQLQMVVALSVAIPLMMLTMIVRNPNGWAATILSQVPLFSPILMFARIIIQTPPWWQIALSIVLLIAAIFGAVWLAAKIYRVGVLMYGKPPTLPELLKWLKYS